MLFLFAMLFVICLFVFSLSIFARKLHILQRQKKIKKSRWRKSWKMVNSKTNKWNERERRYQEQKRIYSQVISIHSIKTAILHTICHLVVFFCWWITSFWRQQRTNTKRPHTTSITPNHTFKKLAKTSSHQLGTIPP